MTFVDERILAAFPSPPRGVWDLGPFPLRAYAFFIIVGIIVAIAWGDRRWVARGGRAGTVLDVAMYAVPFGLIGGRIYHVLTDWSTYFGEGGDPLGALRIWQGGLGIWGAVFFGGLGAWIGCRRLRIPLPAFGDAIAPPILLAQAIGRLGNYFNQELYGRETDLPWGLEIYERINSSGAPDTLNGVSTGVVEKIVHPTFLYELLWNLLVVAILVMIDRRREIGHGRLFALYVALYCVGRFAVELMRDDYATHIGGVRINTFTSAIVFLCAMVYFGLATKGREAPEELRPESGRPWPWTLIRERIASLVESQTDSDEESGSRAKVGATAGTAAAVSAAMRAAGAHAGESDEHTDGADDEVEPGSDARVGANAGTAAAVSAAMRAAGRSSSADDDDTDDDLGTEVDADGAGDPETTDEADEPVEDDRSGAPAPTADDVTTESDAPPAADPVSDAAPPAADPVSDTAPGSDSEGADAESVSDAVLGSEPEPSTSSGPGLRA